MIERKKATAFHARPSASPLHKNSTFSGDQTVLCIEAGDGGGEADTDWADDAVGDETAAGVGEAAGTAALRTAGAGRARGRGRPEHQ